MRPYVHLVVLSLWLVFVVVWVAGAFATKPTARRQSRGSRLRHRALGLLAVAVMFTKYFQWLARPFYPASSVVAYTGLVLTAAGIGFAVWARFSLGENWSGIVTVKQNHTLVRQGPYEIVRHPIYSGILLGLLGTALADREWRTLVAAGLLALMLVSKSRLEERFMTEEFGDEYREYQRRVKGLIPFVW
ncbi:MAG: isoprenylcysteine carboxylmethyltransferase family protein [Acidobacteria bacterium]|nr:isoprenylcysteine carboxylmethyltransferase family protein [Acidobacteriota bacterium]